MIAKRQTLAAFVLLSVIGAVNGQESESRRSRQITTTCSVTVNAKPDAARLSFFVVAEVPKNAREENDKQVATMKEKLAALSLTNVEIQTVPFPLSTLTTTERAGKGFGARGAAAPVAKGTKLQHAQTEFVLLVHEKDADKLCALVTKLADLAVENGASSTGTIDDPFTESTLSMLRSSSSLKIDWLRKTPPTPVARRSGRPSRKLAPTPRPLCRVRS